VSQDEHKLEAFRRIVEDEVLTSVFSDLESEYLEKMLSTSTFRHKRRSELAESIKVVRDVRSRIEVMYEHALAMKQHT